MKDRIISIWKRVTHIMTTTKAFIVSAPAVIGLFIFVLIVLFYYGKGNYYAYGGYLISKTMDSLQTEIQLENIINGTYVGDYNSFYREFWGRDYKYRDLRYLPYCYIALLDERYLPRYIAYKDIFMVDLLCDNAVDSVFYFGDTISVLSHEKYWKLCRPDSVIDINKIRESWRNRSKTSVATQIESKSCILDSLRIRVIGYNDRNALSLLEKYYSNSGTIKELAVYYKIMLGVEGNGDVAERYYKVLKPYLAEQPEFFNSIRDVLLRAAICDHNERARQLCDSLGISLCDYRLSVLDE